MSATCLTALTARRPRLTAKAVRWWAAGTAIRESMEIIGASGASLAGVLISLDRQERGRADISAIQEVERDYHCKVISIVTLKDLIAYLEEKPEMADHLAAVRAYREQYGV